jgi:hypothetical protein
LGHLLRRLRLQEQYQLHKSYQPKLRCYLLYKLDLRSHRFVLDGHLIDIYFTNSLLHNIPFLALKFCYN